MVGLLFGLAGFADICVKSNIFPGVVAEDTAGIVPLVTIGVVVGVILIGGIIAAIVHFRKKKDPEPGEQTVLTGTGSQKQLERRYTIQEDPTDSPSLPAREPTNLELYGEDKTDAPDEPPASGLGMRRERTIHQ